ncbi:MAG: SPOR domain-containing protein [Betaproteobacteria bacterium]
MSFFSFRRGRTSQAKPAAAVAASESVEVVRRRARQRLIGSAVLVLIGVIGFPLLFDSQPRPVPVDIAIDIPSRSAIKPGSPIPVAKPADTALAAKPALAEAAPEVAPQASLQGKEEIVSSKPADPASAAASAANPAAAAVRVPAPAEPAAKAGVKAPAADGQPAQDQPDNKPASGARVVVQVGAYGEAAKAREVRQKLEKAGFKTYTQVIDTKDGSRTRVRVGPFASRAEAEKAAAKIKSLDLPASLLAL